MPVDLGPFAVLVVTAGIAAAAAVAAVKSPAKTAPVRIGKRPGERRSRGR